MKIAMTDMDIVWEDRKANMELCREMIEEASKENADLILFPEMTLSGFSMNVEKICDIKEETIDFFSGEAKRNTLNIGFGYVSMEKGKGKNHFCITDKTGNVQADYVKIHPFTYGGESEVYTGGKEIVSFQMAGVQCGMFICYDLRFPEAFQQLPMDTSAIFVIANWPESRMEHWHTLLKARAIEMQCYVVGVNRVGIGGGLTYVKSSVCYSPEGKRLEETQGKWNRYVELDFGVLKRYIETFPTRKDRRPDIYFS